MSNKTNKEKNKEIFRKNALEKEIEENPDWCYCEEMSVLEPDVDLENDKK